MKTLTWVKSTKNEWLLFETFSNLADIETVGVYIIWHGGETPWTVYVGQGDVKDRLTDHRGNSKITAYNSKGALRVTWAAVASQADRDGIERYLADQLSPLVGEKHPNVTPVAVKLPWAA
jgi:hypothetical protein